MRRSLFLRLVEYLIRVCVCVRVRMCKGVCKGMCVRVRVYEVCASVVCVCVWA